MNVKFHYYSIKRNNFLAYKLLNEYDTEPDDITCDTVDLTTIHNAYRQTYNRLKDNGDNVRLKSFKWKPADFKKEIRRRYQVDEDGKLAKNNANELLFCLVGYLFENKQVDAPRPSGGWVSHKFRDLANEDYFTCIPYAQHTDEDKKGYTKMVFKFFDTFFRGITIYSGGFVYATDVTKMYKPKDGALDFKVRFIFI